MVRRVDSRRRTKESWSCENHACGFRVRISDHDLLERINLLLNRIIENNALLIPTRHQRKQDSPTVARLQQEIDAHLQSDHPSEDFIISKITNIASQLYIEANSTEMVTALIARKRAMLMRPQDFFNPDYFSDLVETISLGESGQIKIRITDKEKCYFDQTWNPKAIRKQIACPIEVDQTSMALSFIFTLITKTGKKEISFHQWFE